MRYITDLERQLRRAAKASADAALAANLELATHIDNRLPARIKGDGEAFSKLMDAVFSWALRGATGGTAAVAIWRETDKPDWPLMIEGIRRQPPDSIPLTDIPGDLESLAAAAEALDGVTESVVDDDEPLERLHIHLPNCHPTTARRVGDAWGGAFDRKRMLMIRNVLFDANRCHASLASIGLSVDFTIDLGQAKSWVGSNTYDFIVICQRLLGSLTNDTALQLAELSPDAKVFLIGENATLPRQTPTGIDSAFTVKRPWIRLLDLLLGAILQQVETRSLPTSSNVSREIPKLDHASILIAEDVATAQSMLSAILAPTGANLLFAENGTEAIRTYRSGSVDLILMDIQMPEMDGLAAARAIRSINPDAKIIALTAYAQERDKLLYQRLGMQGFLAKPVRIDDLYQTLRRHLIDDNEPNDVSDWQNDPNNR